MGKTGVLNKIRLPQKKTAVKAAIALIVIILVIGAIVFMFSGEKKVEYSVLGDKEIPQDIVSQVIPEYRQLERALACVVDGKVYVVASRGEKPTSGYEIAIDKMALSEKDGTKTLVVYTKFKDPSAGTALTQAITYPIQVAETSLTDLPDQIELKVQYVE
ncbi:protease complex subunit PrcB family protein [Bacilliculturomica massiliensis]|uniref:protease complex subunit PrcB family protein n=1 Tax=Bacilliculturomica massiliensis TaxID=1917867 RepID=UPI0010324482|nr:protease complex subunit PrcB family protein [Bacilliculturomica massiliensis]